MKNIPNVPPRFHQDGWTIDVQTVFLETLMTTGSVREAARSCGKTPSSAYKRRKHPDGAAFQAGWAEAIAACMERVRETAIDRAFNGRLKPIFKNGVQTGEELVFNDRLLIALMRLYDAPAYHAERALAVPPVVAPEWTMMTRDEAMVIYETTLATVRAAQDESDPESAARTAAETAAAETAAAAGDAAMPDRAATHAKSVPGVSKQGPKLSRYERLRRRTAERRAAKIRRGRVLRGAPAVMTASAA